MYAQDTVYTNITRTRILTLNTTAKNEIFSFQYEK